MTAYFAASPLAFIAVIFLLGLAVGSFLNVVIYRLPIMMERVWREHCAELLEQSPPAATGPFNLVRPRSACPACGAPIRAWQNIPIVSWLLLKGRCAACGCRISVRYPMVELITGLASAMVAWRFGFGWEAGFALLLTWALIAASAIDIDRQLLPDSITLPLLWLGLGLSLFHGEAAAATLFIDSRSSIIGTIAGYLSLWSVYQLFKMLTGREGMGYGDFKLLGALGAWLGWQMLPLVILVSAFVGAVVGIALIVFAGRGRHVPIPFGPYLAAAGWIALLWGDSIVDAYLGLSGFT
ncbi:MAG: prepilin peptidase [Gammaproteobacteria bacterium]|nr:prepilin peptidase [Gammaproteobacteria bacterium]